MDDSFISTEHFFVAMLKLNDNELNLLFKKHGVKLDTFLKTLKTMRGSQKVTDEDPETKMKRWSNMVVT